MPIYEYICSNCDKEFETLVFGSDEPVACPQCDKKNVRRLMSACSFKSSGNATPSSGSSNCASCSSTNCSSCH